VKVKAKQKNRHHIGMAPKLCCVHRALVIPSNTVLLAVVMHFLYMYHSTATLLRRCCSNS